MMLFILLILSASAHAQNASDLFAQAHNLYQKKECTQALALYDQIPHKGAATWYNMGNCAYKLNDQIHALLYWKRAYHFGNATIQKNSLENMKLLSIPHRDAATSHAQTNPLLMQILFFCIFSVFLILGYFLVRTKRWVFLAMCFSVLVYAGYVTYQVSIAAKQALVMHNDATLHAGPGPEFHQLGTLNAGTTVTILKQYPEWAQITFDGQRGWIENKQIEKIF